MSRFKFELATPNDDRELRHIIAQTPTPGAIAISFAREPDFFDSLAVEGGLAQVVVCRDTLTGRLAGFGIRSIRERYVNGQPTPIGYLSGLRALPEYRSLGLVARGYHFLRELHQDGRTQLYLTTIAEDNAVARRVLTAGRAGLPRYHPAGRFLTRAIPIPRRKQRPCHRLDDIQLQTADQISVQSLVDWLNSQGALRNFFPVYRDADLFQSQGGLKGLSANDLILATRGGSIRGSLGAWNQTSFRQTIVAGYNRRLQWLRPWYNLWQAIRGQPGIPAAGQPLSSKPIAVPLQSESDAERFARFVRCLIRQQSGQGVDCLLLGLHETDPLSAATHILPGITYTTHLYLACWDDGEELRESLDGRPLYLEVGSL